MEFLIRAALIVDSSSPHHLSRKDLFISNGIIEKIEDQIPFDGTVIQGTDIRVSCGWIDMRAHFCDPGTEHKEDLETGSSAAMSGGFTDVLLLPNTTPVVQSKNAISFYQKWNRTSLVNIHPSAAVSIDCEGKELTEMLDLNEAGAIAFTDGINPIWHTDILLKSLMYVQKFKGLVINRPEDKMLTAFGAMNEGEVSTSLGMKGMPSIAEELMLKRDLQLLEYAGGRIHFSLVSSTGAVDLIKAAKKKGLNVTADVSAHHLVLTEDALTSFDADYKINPPLRSEGDRKSLIKAVKDGVIDVVVTDHQPQDEESKKLEFDLADFGISGLETFYPELKSVFGDETDEIIEKSNKNARSILGIEQPTIKVGQKACLTVYTPDEKWFFDLSSSKSKSQSSPFFGKELEGRVLAVSNKGQLSTAQ